METEDLYDQTTMQAVYSARQALEQAQAAKRAGVEVGVSIEDVNEWQQVIDHLQAVVTLTANYGR